MKEFIKSVKRYLKSLDYLLILLCVSAGIFSIILLYSIYKNGFVPSLSQVKTQIFSLVLGLIAALIVAAIDYKFISKMWFLYAPVALILSLLLFTSLGVTVEGTDDTGWLDLGFIMFQPVEILKVAFILSLSTHVSKLKENLNKLPHLALVCLHGVIPVLMVSMQGDDGSASVFLFIFIFIVFSAGLAWRYIITALVSLPVVAWGIWTFVMQPHHKMRFLVLFNPEIDTSGTYVYQSNLGTIALGSGQLTGKGLFGGNYTYVPEIYNDFIFSYIGMTLGFLGCIATIALLAFICIKILSDSLMAVDMLGKLICTGVFAMVLFHSVINIGMVLRVVPVIGIPLPFISAGGTSMISLFVSIGLVLSVRAHRTKKQSMFIDNKE